MTRDKEVIHEVAEPLRLVRVTAQHNGCGGWLSTCGVIRGYEYKHECSRCEEILWLHKTYPRIEYEDAEGVRYTGSGEMA